MVITMLEDIKGIGPKSLLALKALNLYKKVGFEYIGNISTWIWNRIG